jgi:hypothetical protein
MSKLYLNKIKNKEINPITGNTWVIDDVPVLWIEKVRGLLEKNEPI